MVGGNTFMDMLIILLNEIFKQIATYLMPTFSIVLGLYTLLLAIFLHEFIHLLHSKKICYEVKRYKIVVQYVPKHKVKNERFYAVIVPICLFPISVFFLGLNSFLALVLFFIYAFGCEFDIRKTKKEFVGL